MIAAETHPGIWAPPILIGVFDDSAADRLFFHDMMAGGDRPFVRNVTLDFFSRPLDDLQGYRVFDGVVLDEELFVTRGSELAARIHLMDWRIPIALVTGHSADALPPQIRMVVGAVGFKHGAARHRIDSEHAVMRAWIRGIALAKTSYREGFADGALEAFVGEAISPAG